MRHFHLGSPYWRAWLRAALFCGLLLVAIVPVTSAADAGRSPSRLLPSNGLYSYVEYDGLNGHEKAWKATAAYDILGRTPSGAVLSEVMLKLLDELCKMTPDRKFSGAEILAIQEHMVAHGFALADYEEVGAASRVYVLKAVGKHDTKLIALVRRYILMPDDAGPLPPSSSVRSRAVFKFGGQEVSGREAKEEPDVAQTGADLFRILGLVIRQRLTTWFEGTDLIIVQGPDGLFPGDKASRNDLAALHSARVTAVFDAIDGKGANVSAHSAYVAASAQGQDLAGLRVPERETGRKRFGRCCVFDRGCRP
jgi:hypothetical protein